MLVSPSTERGIIATYTDFVKTATLAVSFTGKWIAAESPHGPYLTIGMDNEIHRFILSLQQKLLFHKKKPTY